ncbi:MAG: hypothetical protein LC623_04600 [Halobacteriales archaeon]|nr:hypothetical protein [Halobacteriales archaeon]
MSPEAIDNLVKFGQVVPVGGAVYGAILAQDHGLWFLAYALVAYVVFWVIWQVIQMAGHMRRDWQYARRGEPREEGQIATPELAESVTRSSPVQRTNLHSQSPTKKRPAK